MQEIGTKAYMTVSEVMGEIALIIKVLIENTTDSNLKCEHGLSLYIEYKNKKVLLDAGSTCAFAENADKMGVDLEEVDLAFLSHGHYDHSGGFGIFCERNKKAPIYAMEQARKRYASASGGILHEIGVPEAVLKNCSERFVLLKEMTEIAGGIVLVPHSTAGAEFAQIGEKAGLYREAKEGENALCRTGDIRWVPDDFLHEMSVVFETDKGLVICNSCSHGGVQNIVKEVKAALPDKHIYAYVGGLHMKGKRNGEEICTFTEAEVQELTDFIKTEGIEILLTGHCTGAPAMQMLKERLEVGTLQSLCSGAVYQIGE
ncbi:MAG: MBL fold metallo-hydrolase [Lachnospiraceae bacterium]|nr:MBL fold metallo-hydrolase [Lachnospiraceae bacterium]